MPIALSRLFTNLIPARSARAITAACVLAATMVGPALADDFVDRVNAMLRKVGDDKRSDKVVLPLLPAMTPPPAVLKDQFTAGLYSDKGPSWTECKAWAQAEPQKKVIEAIAKVTKDENDPQRGFAFSLPYGTEATDPELVTKDMYVDLGDPPTLAGAKFLYLDDLEKVGILMHVEASRLLEAGDVSGSLGVMKNWVFFSRQMCDRPFLKEKEFGLKSLAFAIERIADLTYTDFRAADHKLQPSALVNIVGLMRDRSLYIDRIRLPEAEYVAREQLINKVIIEKDGPNPETFASTMARVSSVDRPLRLFSTAAYWDQVRPRHVGWYDALKVLNSLKADWEQHWKLSPFDVFQQRQPYYKLYVKGRPRYAVVGMGLDDFEELFVVRRRIEVIQVGTRMGMAVYAYFLRERVLPTSLAATRPRYTRQIDTDPYSSKGDDLRYFIPVQQTPKDEHGNDKPFSLRLWLPDPLPNFEVPLDKTQFVIYSVGPDDSSQAGLTCTQGRPGTGDYLLWPPPLSLMRQKMIGDGTLK